MKSIESTRLFDYRPFWAECFGVSPFLPTSREEMDVLGWDSCDIIIVTGDAYVDHASFGMAVIGRVLEAQGFRVGIIAQPDWKSKKDFQKLGKPNLYFGVAAGNMDSMINRYTADKKIRHDDAYTPGNVGGKRPDRAVIVYSQRCREAFRDVPLVIGSIEASLRRIAHFDYWSEKVRRSILIDSKADILLYGNAERAIVELSHRMAAGEQLRDIKDIRGTAFVINELPNDLEAIDSSTLSDEEVQGGSTELIPAMNPYETSKGYSGSTSGSTSGSASEGASESSPACATPKDADVQVLRLVDPNKKTKIISENAAKNAYVILPSYEQVKNDQVLYGHSSRILHRETNPHNALPLVQAHGDRYVWLNSPPIPLSTEEMDWVFGLPYQRVPHPYCGEERIPAYDMIRF